MADYTFEFSIEFPKNNSSIQTIFDVDALAAPAKAALAGYIASLELPTSQTQHLLWENVGIAVFMDSLAVTYYLPSLGSQTPAPDLKRTSSIKDKVVEMQALESKFPKCQMLMFTRSSASAAWVWRNTEVIQNSGNRVNTLKILPYLNQKDVFVPGRGTQIGLQFIAEPAFNTTLPQEGDRVTVHGSMGLDVNPIEELKKNNETEQLKIRMAALEALLQPFGAATASAAGTTGLVQGAAAGQSEHLLRADRTWQDPLRFVSAVVQQLIQGAKTFAESLVSNKAVSAKGSDSLSSIGSINQAIMFATGGGAYLALAAPAASANAKIIDFGMYPDGTARIRRVNDSYTAASAPVAEIDASGAVRLYKFSAGNTVFSRVISESFSINPASLASGSVERIILTVSGASVGDFCHVAPVNIELLANAVWPFQFTAVVTAPNQVSLYLVNQWSATLDLGQFQVRVFIVG